MKHLALILAALCGVAQAGTMATLPNEVGGTINFTDAKCNTGNGFVVMSTHPNGRFITGCFFVMDEFVYTSYDGGGANNQRVYKVDDLTLTEYGRNKLRGTK